MAGRCRARRRAAGEAEAARTRRPVEVDDSLLVPIVRKGEAIGVLRLTARVRRRWERSAVDLASAIAGQIALVAENARLYREAQAQARELAALREVGTTLTSTLDLTTVLDAVVDAAVRLSGAQQCAVLELDPECRFGAQLGGMVRDEAVPLPGVKPRDVPPRERPGEYPEQLDRDGHPPREGDLGPALREPVGDYPRGILRVDQERHPEFVLRGQRRSNELDRKSVV